MQKLWCLYTEHLINVFYHCMKFQVDTFCSLEVITQTKIQSEKLFQKSGAGNFRTPTEIQLLRVPCLSFLTNIMRLFNMHGYNTEFFWTSALQNQSMW